MRPSSFIGMTKAQPRNKISRHAFSVFSGPIFRDQDASGHRSRDETYGMMVNLTAEEEQLARERVTEFLSGRTGDENRLVVEGIKFLRGKPARGRR
jgi:hypothetical protein